MNLRPSGYEPDELPGCSTPRQGGRAVRGPHPRRRIVRESVRVSVLCRFGGDLLSHVLRRSTIGAVALNGRVRDGIGCFAHAVTTKPAKHGLAGRGARVRHTRRALRPGPSLKSFTDHH